MEILIYLKPSPPEHPETEVWRGEATIVEYERIVNALHADRKGEWPEERLITIKMGPEGGEIRERSASPSMIMMVDIA